MAKSKVYAVAVGRKVGIFDSWADCETQVKGYSGAKFKSFASRTDAEQYIDIHGYGGRRRIIPPPPPTAAVDSNPTPTPKTTTTTTTTTDRKEKKRPLPQSKDSSTIIPPIRYIKRVKPTITNPDISFLISFDGGSRGNPGLAGCGAEVIEIRRNPTTGENLRSKTRLHFFLPGKHTNNQAEYWGLIKALDHVHTKLSSILVQSDAPIQLQQISLAVQGDSKLIIQQMKGDYRVGPVLSKAHDEAQSWIQKINDLGRSYNFECLYSWEHVYRADNRIADECANKAMDARRSWMIEIDSDGIEIRHELPDIDLTTMESHTQLDD